MSEVLKKLPVFQNPEGGYAFLSSKSIESKKKILITNSKYDLNVYLGK